MVTVKLPQTKGSKMDNARRELVEVLLKMNYGELKDVATEFAGMIDAEVRPKIETTDEFAELLFDWAFSQKEETLNG